MKADTEYAAAPQSRLEFPPIHGMAFTDQVSHAAMAGQFQLEQTFRCRSMPCSTRSVPRSDPSGS